MNNDTGTKIIGLTGQTGAGKSTAAKFMSELSCAVIDADSVSRRTAQKDSPCLKRLAQEFGGDIINKDGSCNRRLLAQRAFSSDENTERLNSVTHPYIVGEIKKLTEELSQSENDIIIIDAPQLFESGLDSICDFIISVTAPEKTRMNRIMHRDGLTEREALMRMNAQYDNEFFEKKSDYIIDGSEKPEQVRLKSREIIMKIRESREADK